MKNAQNPTPTEADQRNALHDLICKFQLAFDLHDWDLLASCLHHEVYTDYSSFRATQPGMQTREEYVALRRQALSNLSMQHNFLNLRIELAADAATGYCNYAIHRFEVRAGAAQDFFHSFGRYVFNFVRADGEWAISGIKQDLTANVGNPELHTGSAAHSKNR